MKKIYTTLLLALVYQSAPLLADNTYQYILDKYGYEATTARDLSGKQKIELAEPYCAYVNITGIDKMPTSKTQNLHAWLECYDGNGNYFKKRVILNAQGNSSLAYPKKNISIEFYETSWGNGKTTDITWGDWVKQDEFHLKAYYTDYFRGAGKIAYDIYDDIVSDREQPLPWQRAGVTTASDKAMCHPNGFPCYVYLNCQFYGLYVWSLKKNHKNMGQEKDNAQHIHIDGLLADNTIFKGNIDWSKFDVRTPKILYSIATEEQLPGNYTPQYKVYDGDAPLELIDNSMPYFDPNNENHLITNQVKKSLIALSNYYANLMKLVSAGSVPETIKTEFSNCFDTQGFTDYIVHSLVTNNYDGHWKNWQWFTYDGVKWYVEPYDLDCTFGHHDSGTIIFPPEWNSLYCSHFYQFPVNAGIQKLFLEYFFENIKNRYIELRVKKLIDGDRYSQYFRNWAERIGEEGYEMEHTKWGNSPCFIETVVNPNWETEDNWENYGSYPTYSPDSTYHTGDRCKVAYRIWTATGTTKGVRPYKQIGQVDSQERIENWIKERILLLDEYFSFDPDRITDLASDKQKVDTRKVILAGHLYIIKNNETYSIDGKRVK
ncbi:MAG: CotH kinase family protein [Prevotella sp.]|nr:CotH kinase family protein [Prevotella sp.]MBQ9293902.1 CotH kinase family protein [Bacteroidaceae bacterium]